MFFSSSVLCVHLVLPIILSFLPSLFCCFSTTVRSRGAVRLIRARVRQEIRWAFVMSCVSHTNSGAQGQASTAHPHSDRRATAERTRRERCWDERDLKYTLSLELTFCIAQILCYIHFSLMFWVTIINFNFSHACCIMFSGAPVVYSGLFAALVLWFYLSKRITLGSITLCHHPHWCCCWDISLCLNPSCVIKVPLCISSPSLSENLSCPLMGVCWWVLLIVGYGFAMSFVPAVTLLPIVWCSLAPLHKEPVIFSLSPLTGQEWQIGFVGYCWADGIFFETSCTGKVAIF